MLARSWWRPRRGPLAWLLWPLSLLYAALYALRQGLTAPSWHPPCPVIVVGNLVVGGAGKTPTVIALVQAMREAGYRPGVVSRGHGRRTQGVLAVDGARSSTEVGDEPWLIERRTGVPVVVGEDRVGAAQALLAAHPEVDLLIADDGLQHRALHRDAELWVFDERGVGNGQLLPAGPLRQRLPGAVPVQATVLYNAPQPSTPLPGALAQRRLAGAVDLVGWKAGQPMQQALLEALRGREVLAIAGIGAPGRFFAMLRDRGLVLRGVALADHARFDTLPWPPNTTEVLCSEKDAVKIDPSLCGATRVWVIGLDFSLPAELLASLRQRIAPPRASTT